MSRADYVANLKLCLEILSRFEIYPDLEQLDHFLADEKNFDLLNQATIAIKTAWENFQHSNDPGGADPAAIAIDSNADLISPSLVSLEKQPEIEPPPESEPVMINQPPKNLPVRFKLPNATVGKTYQGQLEWTSAKPISLVAVDGLEQLGLSFDASSNSVSGEPTTAGEHTLAIHYQQNDDSVQSTQIVELNLVINSDPKSLWKNIPPDASLPFWKTDSNYQGKYGISDWKLAAASKRGRSHAHVGSCRDDDFALRVDNETGWHLLAVADGAGSSEFSREGAKIVAHNSVEILSPQLAQANPILNELIEYWQLDKSTKNEIALQQVFADLFSVVLNSSVEKIAALAKQQQVAYRDFYSTLLVAAHKSFPHGEFTVAYWIGDGGLAIYTAEHSVTLLGISDSGEYAGQTRFLDSNALERDDLLKRLHFHSQKTFTALILMTDGITDPLFETDNNLRDLSYWDKLWQQIQPKLAENPELSAQNLTDWLDFWSPGNHDDRTIALIYR